jgi:hypothetical protein
MAASALERTQTVFMAPVLLAFVIGSLPVLLPLMLYRKLASRPSAPKVAESLSPAPETVRGARFQVEQGSRRTADIGCRHALSGRLTGG